MTVSSNGKIERWFKTLKSECLRVTTPLCLEDARRLVAEFVTSSNTVRLPSPKPSVIYSPPGEISQKKLENPTDFWNNVGENTSSLFQNKGAFE